MDLKETWPHGNPVLKEAPGRTCGPIEREAHTGAGFLLGLVTLWVIPHWRRLFLKDMEETHGGAVHEVQPVRMTQSGEVFLGLSPMGGTSSWSRKSLRSPAHEEERMAETTCDELASTPILCPCTVLVEEVEKIMSKVRPGKKRGVGGKCFNI